MESLRLAFPISLHLVLALNVGKACLSYFPAFSEDPKRRDSVRLEFPISLHLVLAIYALKSLPCFPCFPTFSDGSKRRETLHPVFPISLHLVLNLNVGKVFALPSLSSYI